MLSVFMAAEVYCVARLDSNLDEIKLFSTSDAASDYVHDAGIKSPVVLVYKLNPATREFEFMSFAEPSACSSDSDA